MRKIRLNTVVILLVIAMIALLIFQAVQSAQLYDRKSTELKDRLTTTLDRIALRHEKAEGKRRYLEATNQDFDAQYREILRDILKEEIESSLPVRETISVQDTMVFENGKMQDYLVIRGKSFDSISGVTAEQHVLVRNVQDLQDLMQHPNGGASNANGIEAQLDPGTINQALKKAQFVSKMMVDVFRNDLYISPNQRLDVTFLDSVLKLEFAADNLPESFEFVVTDTCDTPIQFTNTPDNYVTSIDLSGSHSTELFPSDPVDDQLYLHVRFPAQKSLVIKEMGWGLIVNLLLMTVIIVALIVMFRTILTQKKLSEMKNDFISNMTHEFKTPIATISLACEAMSDPDMVKDMNSETQPYVNMIHDENKRLSLLVERILQSGTMERGELKIRPEAVAFDTVVKNVVDNAQFRVKNSGGKVTINVPDGSITITADPMHTANVVSNLIDNAIKYSDKSPNVTVDLKEENNVVVLTVRDEGIGIKKEHLNKIFDKLYRIPTGNIHNVKGFGLGLSYVKAIADLHGWNVRVKSKFGAGTEFTIEIKQ